MDNTKKLTPGGNWMWEGSRMMLPEHKIRLNDHQRGLTRRPEPNELDDQELQLISQEIRESLEQKTLIGLKLFDPWEQRQVIGVVERVDQRSGRFMVDGEWFKIHEVEGRLNLE